MDKYKKNSKNYFVTKIISMKKKTKTLKISDTSTEEKTNVSNPELGLSEIVKKTNNNIGRNKNKSKLIDL